MYTQRTSIKRTHGKHSRNKGFDHAKRGGGFRVRSKSPKLDISSFINKTGVSSVPDVVFVPEHSCEDFKLKSVLLRAIEQRGYTSPTPIQDKIIPSILEGKDVV